MVQEIQPDSTRSTFEKALDVGRAFGDSIEGQINGAVQLATKVSGVKLPEVDFVATPKAAEPYSAEYYAQSIASAAAAIPTFYFLNKCLTPRSAGALMAGCEGSQAALTGFLGDALFRKVDENDFWNQRLQNGIIGGATFGTLGAASRAISGLPILGSAAEAGMIGRAARGALAGIPAGLVGAETDSLLKTGNFATAGDLGRQALDFSVVGAGLGALHWQKGPQQERSFSGDEKGVLGKRNVLALLKDETGAIGSDLDSFRQARSEKGRGSDWAEDRYPRASVTELYANLDNDIFFRRFPRIGERLGNLAETVFKRAHADIWAEDIYLQSGKRSGSINGAHELDLLERKIKSKYPEYLRDWQQGSEGKSREMSSLDHEFDAYMNGGGGLNTDEQRGVRARLFSITESAVNGGPLSTQQRELANILLNYERGSETMHRQTEREIISRLGSRRPAGGFRGLEAAAALSNLSVGIGIAGWLWHGKQNSQPDNSQPS